MGKHLCILSCIGGLSDLDASSKRGPRCAFATTAVTSVVTTRHYFSDLMDWRYLYGIKNRSDNSDSTQGRSDSLLGSPLSLSLRLKAGILVMKICL